MKIVIDIHDIPQNDHERWVLKNGTPLSEDATNGYMIETMFPDVEIEENPVKKKCGCFYLKFKGNTCTMVTDYNWWNAPYKRGEKDADSN